MKSIAVDIDMPDVVREQAAVGLAEKKNLTF